MNFHDSAFEKAYLQIIKESADGVCPDCNGTGELEDGTPCPACAEVDETEVTDVYQDEQEEDGDEAEECGDEAEECGDDCQEDGDEAEECGDDCQEDSDEAEEDGEEADTKETETADTDDAADADADTPAEGKFISFFTTDENLIKALQDGFAKISVTGTDEKAEPVDFEADVFENLSVEDLKDDEAAADDAEAPAEDQTDADAEAAAEDDKADDKADKK